MHTDKAVEGVIQEKDATATKGFYMHYDKNVKKSHSKSALPWSFVHDVGDDQKFDWMIRGHLVPQH